MTTTPEKPETTVDVIERALVRRILRGEYPPGANLPSVRALAAEFDVTGPTIQRVNARLEAHGLVEARHGSGVRVLDARRSAGLSLLPHWFDALSDQPAEATRVFRECMEIRRLVALRLAPRIDLARSGPEITAALQRCLTADTPEGVQEADLAFSRAVLDAADHFGVTALFNTVEKIIRSVPGIADAFYGDLDLHRDAIIKLVAAFGAPPESRDARVLEAFEAWDVAAAERFEAYLSARAGATPRGAPARDGA